MSKRLQLISLFLIISVAFLLRFYQLGENPAGLHFDAASQAYNAYSILHTGKDRYGEPFPLLFRAYGTYQPPLYTYLTIIPVSIFGNSIFSAHFISALSGTLLVFFTYLFISSLFKNNNNRYILASIAAITVATIPWSIFFSRLAVEANLSLLVFAISVTLFFISLKRIQTFPFACAFLALSTHTYYSEQVIAVVFLPLFIILFREKLFKDQTTLSSIHSRSLLPGILTQNKRLILLGILVFSLILLPHIITIKGGAFTRRFNQVSHISNQSRLGNESLDQILSRTEIFIENYISYYNPKNLFFTTDQNLGRLMPELGTFYSWLIIPFLLGLRFLLKNRSSEETKLLGLLFIITPIPAGLTGDFFYPLRTLSFLWVTTLITAIGIFYLFKLLSSAKLKILILTPLLLYSFFSLYVSYFILSRYDGARSFGYSYSKFIEKLPEYKNKHFLIDSIRDVGIGVRLAYFKEYDPNLLQKQLRSQMKTPYYSQTVNKDENYLLDNIEVRHLDWRDVCKSNTILVGDSLAISPKQAKDHNLILEFEIKDLSGQTGLQGYSTNPYRKCTVIY